MSSKTETVPTSLAGRTRAVKAALAAAGERGQVHSSSMFVGCINTHVTRHSPNAAAALTAALPWAQVKQHSGHISVIEND